jgi:hypothetical protein
MRHNAEQWAGGGKVFIRQIETLRVMEDNMAKLVFGVNQSLGSPGL